MQFPKDKISASTVNLYRDCPLAFKLIVVDGFEPEEGPALEIGSMFDTMFKSHYEGKDPFKEAKIKHMDGIITKQQIKNFKDARKIMEEYLKKPEKFTNPKFDIGFKVQFKHPIEDKMLEYPLSGFMDGVDFVSDEEIDGIEVKTTSMDYTEQQVKEALQRKIYAYYMYNKYGRLCPITYIVFNKKSLEMQKFKVETTLEDFTSLFEILEQFIADVRAEKFDRNPNHPRWCACRKAPRN